MKLSQLMKRNPVTIDPEATLIQAAQVMRDIDAGVLPVGSEQELIGVITDRDIIIRAIAEGKDPSKVKVREMMTKGTVCCAEDTLASKAFDTMQDNHVGRLLVTGSDGKIIGIVSLADLIANATEEVVPCIEKRAA